MIRVLIADDHAMVREGFRRIIDSLPDMEVASEAETGGGVLEALADPVDVLILDISMPGAGFIETMEKVTNLRPRLPVLVVTLYPEDIWAVRAFKAGAAGYLTKAHSGKELAEAIRTLHRGGRYVTSTMAERLASLLSGSPEQATHEVLSPREFEVLCRLGAGAMVKTAAREMGVSPRTVSTYRARILEKMAFRSTADIIRYVVEHRLSL